MWDNNLKAKIINRFPTPHIRSLTKTEFLLLAMYGLLIFTFSNILSPGLQQRGLAWYYSVNPSAQVKPFVAVIISPGNLLFLKHTIVIENPQNLTVNSFAFWIEFINKTANLNTTISANTVRGNIEIDYPYGNYSKRELYVVVHNIRPGDSGTINVTLSKAARINITVTRTDARYCAESIYYLFNIQTWHPPFALNYVPITESIPTIVGKPCGTNSTGFPYTIQGSGVISAS